MWISTYMGICKYDAKTGRYINYYAGDGLQGNECHGPSPPKKNISRNFPRNISLPLCLLQKRSAFFLSFPILSNHPTFCNAVGAGKFSFPLSVSSLH